MKKLLAAALSIVTGLFATAVLAAPPDLTSLETAVDFSTATAAVLSVAAALIVVYIAIKASKFVLNMVRGG